MRKKANLFSAPKSGTENAFSLQASCPGVAHSRVARSEESETAQDLRAGRKTCGPRHGLNRMRRRRDLDIAVHCAIEQHGQKSHCRPFTKYERPSGGPNEQSGKVELSTR